MVATQDRTRKHLTALSASPAAGARDCPTLELTHERVDDLPLLLGFLIRLKLPEILDRHLTEVVTSITHASDVRLGAVGLEFDVSRYYPEFVIISSTDEMANRLVPFLASLFEDRPMGVDCATTPARSR